MANTNGKAYALTLLCPIKPGHHDQTAYSDEVRNRLENWDLLPNSPMAQVPQTYLCRYYVLDDVYTQSLSGPDFFSRFYEIMSIFSDSFRVKSLPVEDHLQSKYLVFCCNFHGDLDTYLRGMWNAIHARIQEIWGFCYAFDQVNDADSFIRYVKKCQRSASLFFVGATDDTLAEQLKSLYLKQEFSKFAIDHQGWAAADLQQAYRAFIQRVDPNNLQHPAWQPGQYRLN